jgi:hypothetical protein
MKFDALKECTRCGSDACYTQEVTKDINIEMCYGCGFQASDPHLVHSFNASNFII